jgi:hypothetical protein
MVSASLCLRRKYSTNTRLRKARQRARKDWRQLQHEGWESLEELQCVADELKLPETWQGWKPSNKPGMENVTRHDLLPSIRTIRTLVANLRRQ